MKKEELTHILQGIGLVTAITPFITLLTGIRDAVLRVESDIFAAEVIKYNLEESWKEIYEVAVNIQLQGKDLGSHENLFKSFIMWCYDIENSLDELELTILEQKNASAFATAWKKVTECFDQIIDPDKTGNLEQNIEKIITLWKEILKTQKTIEDRSSGAHDPYLLEGVKIIGRETETNEIVEKLLSRETKIIGVSIIGGCGLGKSSLAQTIIDDQRIREQFYFRKLIKVEDREFAWDDIQKKIDECLATEVVFNTAEGRRASKLFVVFDNLLHMPDIGWDRFWAYTKKLGFKSVKVIITTRDPRISGKTGTEPYHLKTLSDSQCEEVIKENAKQYVEESKLSERSFLSTISDVAKKCGGLPWIAQRLGNILGKRDDTQRKALRETARLWHTEEFQAEFLPKLASCYKDMNSELRRCFSYLSLFPPNHLFDPDELVCLWVAECFTKSNKTGEKYLDDLKRRSILQSVDGQQYKLQSFGHDFAMLSNLGTCLHLDKVSSLSSLNENVRHLSFSCKLDDHNLLQLNHLRLRTFLSMYASKTFSMKTIPNDMIKSLLHVRVLSLRNSSLTDLPAFIEKFKYIRYLDVSGTDLRALPKELGHLIALETLKVKGLGLCSWRDSLHHLTNLRYVDWELSELLENGIPFQIGKLTLLENLPLFRIGLTDGSRIEELKEMNKLTGSLWIMDLQNVRDEQQAKDAMLHNKHELRKIKLQWEWTARQPLTEEDQEECNHQTSVLRGLEPSDNLRELIIKKYKGGHLPEWIINSEIETVHLYECCQVPLLVPTLGKMRKLKALILEDMRNIRQLSCRSDDDADANVCFPELESVEIHNMTELDSWAGVTGDQNIMPRLREMKFVGCSNADLLIPILKDNRPALQIDNQSSFIEVED